MRTLKKIVPSHSYAIMNPNRDTKPKDPWLTDAQLRNALEGVAYNETRGVKGDAYATSQYSGVPEYGQARGRYRVTDADLKTGMNLGFLGGEKLTPQEFQNSRAAQDIFVKNKFRHYTKQGYTPSQIADIHNAGFRRSDVPGGTKYQNPEYVRNFETIYNQAR